MEYMQLDNESLAEFLSTKRKKSKMSLSFVSMQLDITINRLIAIEMGQKSVSMDLLKKFAKIYGFD